MSFAINIGRNISKYLSNKYSHKILEYAGKSAIDALKTASKRAIRKTAEIMGYLFGNEIADDTTKV